MLDPDTTFFIHEYINTCIKKYRGHHMVYNDENIFQIGQIEAELWQNL